MWWEVSFGIIGSLVRSANFRLDKPHWKVCRVISGLLAAGCVVVQGLQVQEREEVEWGEVLHVVHSGLVISRRLLWDESERKIIALLSSSSAFEGDHFLQVSHKP